MYHLDRKPNYNSIYRLLKDFGGNRACVSRTLQRVPSAENPSPDMLRVVCTPCVTKLCYQSMYSCFIRYFLASEGTAVSRIAVDDLYWGGGWLRNT